MVFFASAISAQQRKYMDMFLQAGATSAETAVLPEKLGIRKNQSLRNMIWHGKIVQLHDGRCYVVVKK